MEEIFKRYNRALSTLRYGESLKETAEMRKTIYKGYLMLYRHTRNPQYKMLAEQTLKAYWTYAKEYNKIMNERN